MGDWDWASKWMEEVREDGERNQQQQSSNQKPDEGHVQHVPWSQTLRTLRPWYSFAPVVAVWSVCQLEMLLHPSLSTVEVCCRLLLVCLLWIVLGGCIYALQRCLRPGKSQEELPQRKQQEPATESQNNQHLCMSQTQSSDLHVSLILALTDSLLLCVLQEPIPDPSVPHIEGLLSRLEAVAHTLQKVNVGSVAIYEEVDRGSILKDKPKLICTYLQQRLAALRTLVQVQGDFEASVNDMLQGLDGLWAQLEELHAGVTLTKQEGQGHRDLASAQTDAEIVSASLSVQHQTHLLMLRRGFQSPGFKEPHLQTNNVSNAPEKSPKRQQRDPKISLELKFSCLGVQTLFTVLGQYRSRLQSCQAHLKDSTQLLQELTWSHAHISSRVDSSSESVWPELLLQSNIEQFDKVQEGFSSLEQQTATFQAHLEGLGKGNQGGFLTLTDGTHSGSASPQTSQHVSDVSLEELTSADTPLSLCERSALQLTSTFGRLRKSGRRK